LCRPGQGATHAQKSPCFNWATQFFLWWHTMLHFPLMFLSEWCEFPSAPSLAGKKIMTAQVSMLLKLHTSPDILPFSLCNKKIPVIRHMKRLLFPTTLSIPCYDTGNYFGLRTSQHPLVLHLSCAPRLAVVANKTTLRLTDHCQDVSVCLSR
jgi:hypothetical protein